MAFATFKGTRGLLRSAFLQNQTMPTKPTQLSQTYQAKLTEPNLPYWTYKTKLTKPNLLYQTYQIKPTIANLPNQIKAQEAKVCPELGTAQPQLVSLLSFEWTALLTIVWLTVSYRIYFMAHRLLPSSAPAPTPAKLGWDSLNVRTELNHPPTHHPPTQDSSVGLITCSYLVNYLFITC